MTEHLTAPAVVAEVRECLEAGRRLSVIRLGDGESRLMGWPEFTPLALVGLQLQYWFGHSSFSAAQVSSLAEDLRMAIRQADIIGIPSERHNETSEGWANVERYLEYYELVAPGARFTGCDLHRQLWEDGLLEDLLAGLRRVHIVTCRSVGWQLSKRFGLDVAWWPVPEEGATGKRATNHYPEVYDRIGRELRIESMSGQLVLIGAGVLGKIYAGWVGQAGGVALDIGSVFDGWAGVVSRSHLAQWQEVYAL